MSTTLETRLESYLKVDVTRREAQVLGVELAVKARFRPLVLLPEWFE